MSNGLESKPWEFHENTPNSLGSKMLRELSEPWPSGELVKVAIGRAAKLSGLTYWRAFDIWYCKARRIEAYEIEKIALAIAEKNERDGRSELRELKARLLRLESLLAAGDSNFYSPTINHARELVRQLSGSNRSLACRGG